MSAAAILVSVVVLSKHRPDQLAIEGCLEAGRTVVSLRAAPDGVESCDRSRRCWIQPEVALSCPRGARVAAPSLPSRTYGRTLRVTVREGVLRAISEIEIEPYVAGVVASELAGAPVEAKRAQAIVARTFALGAKAKPRHDDADLCDLTHCQVLRSIADDPTLASTAGRTLTRSGDAAPVFFHSTCGGRTRDAHRVWPDLASTAVVGVSDLDPSGRAYCAGTTHFSWIYEVRQEELGRALSALIGRALDPASLELELRDERVAIRDREGGAELSADRLHLELGRRWGWNTVRSPSFTAERAGASFRLRGRGLGHGVGLCQHGAIERARRGATAEEILRAYFPRLELAE